MRWRGGCRCDARWPMTMTTNPPRPPTNPPGAAAARGAVAPFGVPMPQLAKPDLWRALRAVFFRECWPLLPLALMLAGLAAVTAWAMTMSRQFNLPHPDPDRMN